LKNSFFTQCPHVPLEEKEQVTIYNRYVTPNTAFYSKTITKLHNF